jgi:putative pyoverdin transport system ATP-binding/permease protein
VKLILLLLKYNRGMVAIAISASIVNGAANIGLISMVNKALTMEMASRTMLLWGFAGLCLVLPVTRFASEHFLTELAQKANLDLRMTLCRQILSARLRSLEGVGSPRLIAALTEDVTSITNGLTQIPSYSMQLTVVIGCMIYLAWLSWGVFIWVSLYLLVAILTSQVMVKKGSVRMKLAREDQDTLFKHFRALTEGIKELKLHRRRRAAFLQESVAPTAASYRRHNVAGNIMFSLSNSWAILLSFVLLGMLLFGLPALVYVDNRILVGYTVTLLYMIIHLGVLFSMPPILSRARIALSNIESLGLSLSRTSTELETTSQARLERTWRTCELSGVCHSYTGERENDRFTLGPINLTLTPGELVFLIGGNGSGKTTLAKLLTGLYVPESGEIRLDDEPVTDESRDYYRQHFSAVFSDFFLFESLLGIDTAEIDSRARQYLVKLHLDEKVQVTDGTLSTINLSQGQRKRLALLTSYLEDRAIYVFDEWAADQDPLFKEVFYFQLLPELRARGKTIIVISHDDRYYHLADRLIKLDYGKLVFDKPQYLSNELPAAVALH